MSEIANGRKNVGGAAMALRGSRTGTARTASLRCSSFLIALLLCLPGCGKTDADRLEESSAKIASWLGTTAVVDKASGEEKVRERFAKDALEKAGQGVEEEQKAVAGISAGNSPDFREARAIVARSQAALAHSDRPALLRFSLEAAQLRDRILAAKPAS